MSLAAWFPRPVALRAAGRVVLASELRLADLAALEAFIAAALGSPLAGLDEADADDLRAAYDQAEEGWPPSAGSPLGQAALFATPEGLAFFLALALRETPDLDAAAVAEAITPEEFGHVERAAWGLAIDWRAEALRRIDRHLGLPEFAPRPTGGNGEPITWSQAVGQVVCGSAGGEPLPWASPEAVGRLTLGQWRMVRTGGEPEPEPDALPEDAALRKRVNAARWTFFHGAPPPEPTAAGAEAGVGAEAEIGDDDDAGEWAEAF